MPRCPECNALYGVGDNFCGECGERLEEIKEYIDLKIPFKHKPRYKPKYQTKPKRKILSKIGYGFGFMLLFGGLMSISEAKNGSEVFQDIILMLFILTIMYLCYRRSKKKQNL